MMCGFCQRVRRMICGRPCEAWDYAQRAIAVHERSTQNLTRAALDQIDQSAAIFSETPEEYSDVAAAVEDTLNLGSFGGPKSDERWPCS